jgi:predicted O-methyltransferase YrrM
MTIDAIEKLAGDLRGKSFRNAAHYILSLSLKRLVETGCYRGGPQDGESTLILANLAFQTGGVLDSYEINQDHINKATVHVRGEHDDVAIHFHLGDSAMELAERTEPIDFAYLDSRDFEVNDPGPSQKHQLAEVMAILPKMAKPGIIMVDDCKLKHGGKNGLSHPVLLENGWKLVHDDYTRIYANV